MHMTNIMHILDIIMELTAYFFMPIVSFLKIGRRKASFPAMCVW